MLKVFLALALVSELAWGGNGTAVAQPEVPVGAVYTMTNQATGNQVLMYSRDSNGTLTLMGRFPTGGRGTGDGLGSQGSLVLGNHVPLLFAVNAGSNEISVLATMPTGLRLVHKVNSGGVRPISLTVHNRLLYVLNDGGGSSIAGFTVGQDGHLTPLPNSIRPLSGPGVNPAQIQFSPDGRMLVVTEKASNMIDVYRVGSDGLTTGPLAQPSAGLEPFGFAFHPLTGNLVVSEAANDLPGQASASSYTLTNNGQLQVVSGAVHNMQQASCWVSLADQLGIAFVSNTASGTISSYRLGQDGSLSLVNPTAATTALGSAPQDLAMSQLNRYLYVLNAGTGNIGGYQVMSDGSLMHLGDFAGVPVDAGAQGLAAR
jgi:DNA-binding beta-propeller fold protein YncE